MPTALITGVGGQDGGYLAEQLAAEGVEVHALTLPTDPAMSGLPDVVTHAGDLTDVLGTRRLVLDLLPDEIYNLAAVSSVTRSWTEPDLTAAVNGTAAVALLESALQAQRRADRAVRFAQASSSEIFGQADRTPQDESTPLRPASPYGAAKAFAHLMVDVYRQQGLHATSLILYNHESPRRPPTFVTRKITSAAAAIAAGRSERLALGDLDARRDWGWAPDYVDAMVRAVRAERARDYVVGTGETHSVRDFVTAAFRHAGLDDWPAYVDVDASLFRPTDPTQLAGNAERARNELGWAPTLGFDEVVGRMVEADLGTALAATRR